MSLSRRKTEIQMSPITVEGREKEKETQREGYTSVPILSYGTTNALGSAVRKL